MKALFLFFIILFLSTACHQKPPVLKAFSSYSAGVAQAQKENKPIFLYFTCFGCMGSNEFERHLSKDPAVVAILSQQYIFIELYVDDRAPVKQESLDWAQQQYYPDSIQQQLLAATTVGQFNVYFQRLLSNKFYQPMYVLLDAEEQLLMEPFGYLSKNSSLLLEKLEQGLTALD